MRQLADQAAWGQAPSGSRGRVCALVGLEAKSPVKRGSGAEPPEAELSLPKMPTGKSRDGPQQSISEQGPDGRLQVPRQRAGPVVRPQNTPVRGGVACISSSSVASLTAGFHTTTAKSYLPHARTLLAHDGDNALRRRRDKSGTSFHNNNNNNNIHISIAPYGRNFRGAGKSRDGPVLQCEQYYAVGTGDYHSEHKMLNKCFKTSLLNVNIWLKM